jgi:hypothetical protein
MILTTTILFENGKIILKGPISQADVRNRNDRIYPKKILRSAILELSEKVAQEPQQIYSELEHPSYADIIKERACGLLTEVSWDEDTGIAYCSVEVLESTAKGQELKRNLANGESYGISTRAKGSLDENNIVQNDLYIITADIVKTPSCQICSLTESKSNTLDDFLFESVEECNCPMKKLDMKDQIHVKQHLIDSITNIFTKVNQ